MSDQNAPQELDWKAIATELAQRVNFAMQHLKAPAGSGMLFLNENGTRKVQHWREYMADGFEMIPGVKADREAMRLYDLPRNKQKKAFEELRKSRQNANDQTKAAA